jgi:hypothetical protein
LSVVVGKSVGLASPPAIRRLGSLPTFDLAPKKDALRSTCLLLEHGRTTLFEEAGIEGDIYLLVDGPSGSETLVRTCPACPPLRNRSWLSLQPLQDYDSYWTRGEKLPTSGTTHCALNAYA